MTFIRISGSSSVVSLMSTCSCGRCRSRRRHGRALFKNCARHLLLFFGFVFDIFLWRAGVQIIFLRRIIRMQIAHCSLHNKKTRSLLSPFAALFTYLLHCRLYKRFLFIKYIVSVMLELEIYQTSDVLAQKCRTSVVLAAVFAHCSYIFSPFSSF